MNLIKYLTKMLTRSFAIFILFALTGLQLPKAADAGLLVAVPIEQSLAFQKFSRRSDSELSKLIYLIDCFKFSEIKVLYDDYEYESEEGASYIMGYLRKNYDKGVDAESWVREHIYSSKGSGKINYLIFPDGDVKPARDVFLEELSALNEHLNKKS